MNKEIARTEQTFINEIKTIIHNGQSQAYRAINSAMVETFTDATKHTKSDIFTGKKIINKNYTT